MTWVIVGALLILCGVLAGMIILAVRLKGVEVQLDFHNKLLQHYHVESRVASANAMQAQRLVSSALNGEEARRSVVGTSGPAKGSIEHDLLNARIRWRHNAHLMNAQEMAERAATAEEKTETDGKEAEDAG